VVCDYVGPAECAINAEAGYTTAVASRAGLVARHTGPQRECAALPLPAESPAERTEVCVPCRVPNAANTFINHALDQLFLSANANPIAKKRIQSRKKRKHNLGTELETRNRSDRCTKISRILDEEKRK
jgi:hypothetical protein